MGAASQTRHVLGDLGRAAQEPVDVDVDDARDVYILHSKESGGAKPNTDSQDKLGFRGGPGEEVGCETSASHQARAVPGGITNQELPEVQRIL